MTEQIIKHHIKYKEIHGIDEVVLMTRSDHSKLHIRLRKEGKCNIPPEDLQIISNRAGQRRPDIIHKNNMSVVITELIRVNSGVVQELKQYCLDKHGTLKSVVVGEASQAILDHIKRNPVK